MDRRSPEDRLNEVSTVQTYAPRSTKGALAAVPTEGKKAAAAKVISATPFVWRDPATIPLRRWVYGRHYIRRFVSVTVATSGVGKSSLVRAEALAMVSGRPLLGITPESKLRVWLFNGEDPAEEMERGIAAAMLHYGITRDEVEGRLFLDSGRDQEIKIATMEANGFKIAVPEVEAVIDTIRSNKIDVLTVDPFVSSHSVLENDNVAIDAVAKTWAKIAERCNISIDLVQHSRKTNGAEVTVEDTRGATALIAAARSARTLNTMTEAEKERCGDAVENRRGFFRVDTGKANLVLASDKSDWYHTVSVPLGNGAGDGDNPFGDYIGVVTKWKWPDAFENVSKVDVANLQEVYGTERHRESQQSKDWAGRRIGEILDLDMDLKVNREKVRGLLKAWIKNGVFKTVKEKDPVRREMKEFIIVGQSILHNP